MADQQSVSILAILQDQMSAPLAKIGEGLTKVRTAAEGATASADKATTGAAATTGKAAENITKTGEAVTKTGTALNKTGKEAVDAGQSVAFASQGFSALAGAAASLLAILAGIGSAAAAAHEAVSEAMDFEKANIQLTALIGNAQRANELLESLDAEKQFDFGQLKDAAALLINTGTAAEDVGKEIKALLPISLATGQGVGELASFLARMHEATEISEASLQRFARQGVPIFEALAKQLNVSREQVKALAREGLITFPDVKAALFSLSDEGGKFSGILEAQKDSLGGLLTEIKGGISEFLQQLGTAALPTLRELTGHFLGFVKAAQEALPGIINLAHEVFGALQTSAKFLAGFRTQLEALAAFMTSGLSLVATSLAGVFIDTFKAILDGSLSLTDIVDTLATQFSIAWIRIKGVFFDGIVGGLEYIGSRIGIFIASTTQEFKTGWALAASFVTEAFYTATAAIVAAFGPVVDVASQALDTLGASGKAKALRDNYANTVSELSNLAAGEEQKRLDAVQTLIDSENAAAQLKVAALKDYEDNFKRTAAAIEEEENNLLKRNAQRLKERNTNPEATKARSDAYAIEEEERARREEGLQKRLAEIRTGRNEENFKNDLNRLRTQLDEELRLKEISVEDFLKRKEDIETAEIDRSITLVKQRLEKEAAAYAEASANGKGVAPILEKQVALELALQRLLGQRFDITEKLRQAGIQLGQQELAQANARAAFERSLAERQAVATTPVASDPQLARLKLVNQQEAERRKLIEEINQRLRTQADLQRLTVTQALELGKFESDQNTKLADAQEALNVRALKALNFRGERNREIALYEQQVQQERELREATGNKAELERIQALERAQLKVNVAKDEASRIQSEAQKAQAEFQAQHAVTAALFASEAITSEEAQQREIEALSQVKERLNGQAKALELLIRENPRLADSMQPVLEQIRLQEQEMGRLKNTAQDFRTGMREGLDEMFKKFTDLNAAGKQFATTLITDVGDGFASAFEKMARGTATVKQAFTEMASQIMIDIGRMLVKMAVMYALTVALNSITGGLGGTAVFAGASAARNSGGLIGEEGTAASRGQFIHRANGGVVPGPNVNRDVVPAMLTPGEYVLTRSAVDHYGISAASALNQRLIPREVLEGFTAQAARRSSGKFYNEGGSVTRQAAPEQQPMRPSQAVIVADDQAVERLFAGGHAAVLRFFENNSSEINSRLGA